jgi:hypothetical protein
MAQFFSSGPTLPVNNVFIFLSEVEFWLHELK